MYVVTYKGQFGFIKPWTAVRDGETFSQRFLTPSIIEKKKKKSDVVIRLLIWHNEKGNVKNKQNLS